MIKIYFIILQIIILFNKIKNNSSYLILPFISEKTPKITPEKFFETKFFNNPIINLKIGTHRQLIPCHISINTYTIYISGSNSSIKENIPKYEEYKSIKYRNLSDKMEYESTYIYGIPSIDEIYLNNDTITNIKFYLANSQFNSDKLYFSCVLGLGYEGLMYDYENEIIPKEKIYSFITQIKNNGIIRNKIFFINYNKNNDNGEIIFGSYPHQIKNNYCENCIEIE